MTEVTEGAPEGVTEDVAVAQEVADTPVVETDSGDDAPAEPTEAPKPKKSAQERIDEVTKARRDAERQAEDARRDAEYWREQALRTAPKPDPEPQGDGRPDPSAYADGIYDPAYAEALIDWKAEQVVTQRFAQREAQTRTQTALQSFTQRVSEQYPDGEPDGLAALRRMPQLNGAVQDVILASEIGPRIADHLGANPTELARLSALPPHLIGRELGRLEARLETPAAPKAKTVTDAPEPAPTLRGAGGRFTVAPDTSDFAAFEKQYGG
jgi:hypothetical protein